MYKAKCLKPVYCPKKARARQPQMCMLLKEKKKQKQLEPKIVDTDHRYNVQLLQRKYKATNDSKDVSLVSCHYAEKKLMVLVFTENVKYLDDESRSDSDESDEGSDDEIDDEGSNKNEEENEEENEEQDKYRVGDSLLVELIKQNEETSQFRIADGEIVDFERSDFILIPFQPLQHVVHNRCFNAKTLDEYNGFVHSFTELRMISRIASVFGDVSKLRKVPVEISNTCDTNNATKHWVEFLTFFKKSQCFSTCYYKFFANIKSITGTYIEIYFEDKKLLFDTKLSILQHGDLEK